MNDQMNFVRFEEKHIGDAMRIARLCYLEECEHVTSLPREAQIPDISEFAENGLGIAAVKKGRLLGFLSCYKPWDNHFGTSRGTFIPVKAHGAIKENRGRIYSRMYQAAAEVWVNNGILSHAIGLFSHDRETLDSFFMNGFGCRVMDAVLPLKTITVESATIDCEYKEIEKERFAELVGHWNKLIKHLNGSPMFMPRSTMDKESFLKRNMSSRFFVAEIAGRPVGHIILTNNGESFASNHDSVINIQGAYLEEEYRGKGVYANLLAFTIEKLVSEEYSALGVDFESFNPTARGFWLKYFTPYITSVVRRIDERIMDL